MTKFHLSTDNYFKLSVQTQHTFIILTIFLYIYNDSVDGEYNCHII